MKNISSSELVSRLKQLIVQERLITTEQIELLAEVSRRLVYAEFKYDSLWEFARKELGLSEGSTQRRIEAMRLLRDLPEAKVQLVDGSLSLSNAAKIQSFRRREKNQGRQHDPQVLVAQVTNLSQTECDQFLYQISPEALPQERLRVIAPEARELRIVISEELFQKLERIKGLLAHAKPNATYAELVEYLADEGLRLLEKKRGLQSSDPAAKPAHSGAKVNGAEPSLSLTHPVPVNDAHPTPTAAAAVTLPSGRRVHLPASLRREVWRRGGGKCETCASQYRIEIDHRIPLAQGGANTIDNLRLLCRAHNQLNSGRLESDPWEEFEEFAG